MAEDAAGTPGEAPADSSSDSTSDDELHTPEKLLEALRNERKAARSERAKRGDAEKRATEYEKRLTAIEESQKTELQREREGREAAERERDELRISVLRSQIAAEAKLPDWVASRISGATEDEMRADAKQIAEQLKPPAGHLGGGMGGSVPAAGEDDMNARIRQAAGK